MKKNKCWRECGITRTLGHCWWECKMVEPLGKLVWQFLKTLIIRPFTLLSSNHTPRYLYEKNETKSQKGLS